MGTVCNLEKILEEIKSEKSGEAGVIHPIEQYKILSFYQDAKKLLKGEMIIPRFVSVWLSGHCNLKCSGCWWMRGHESDKTMMDLDKFKSMIDEISLLGVESAEMSGGGESTLHPDFLEMCMYAKSKGMSVGVLTNGTVLSAEYLKAMECPIDTFSYIRVSLDAATSEIYKSIKRSDLWNRVTENITSLIEMRDDNKRPRIGTKFLLNSVNLTEIERMIIVAESIGVDYVHFKAEHSSENTLDDKQARYADTLIRMLKKKHTIPIYGKVQKSKCDLKCFMSPVHAVIDHLGNVYVCCFFSNDDGLIGNIFDRSFMDVWFSGKHKEVIDNITQDMCEQESGGGCRWFGYNDTMHKVIEEHEGDLEFI